MECISSVSISCSRMTGEGRALGEGEAQKGAGGVKGG